MDKTELRNLRIRIKFGMSDMALCCGCPLSTYARYEDGTAAVPAGIERAALELETINREFMEGLPGRVDARLAEEGGLPRQQVEDEWDSLQK